MKVTRDDGGCVAVTPQGPEHNGRPLLRKVFGRKIRLCLAHAFLLRYLIVLQADECKKGGEPHPGDLVMVHAFGKQFAVCRTHLDIFVKTLFPVVHTAVSSLGGDSVRVVPLSAETQEVVPV